MQKVNASVQAMLDKSLASVNGTGEEEQNSCAHPYKNMGVHESYFNPPTVAEFMATKDAAMEWVWKDFLAAGGLAILAGKPKEGKTTFTYELALSIARGMMFLGRPTVKVPVLILALEEHSRDVRLRFQTLDAASLENVYVHASPMTLSSGSLKELSTVIVERGIKLLVIDTLAAFWRVEDENDAAAITKAIKPLLNLARSTGACVLLIHHARKSEGSYGDEIRGSGALFALADIAMIMKRHEVETQRKLVSISRYSETPKELILDLTDDGYIALGDPSSVSKAARLHKVKDALTEEWAEVGTIVERSGLKLRAVHRLLAILADSGEAIREGTGKKGSPYRYRNNIHAAPLTYKGAQIESTWNGSDSCSPTSPCTNEKEIVDAT